MPFPISITGTVSLPKDAAAVETIEEVALRIEDMLDVARASTVTRQGNVIRFTTRLFRLTGSWNVLLPFGSGKIEITNTEPNIQVRYTANTLRLLVEASLIVCLIAIPLITSARQATIFQRTLMIAVSWMWLFGANFVTGVIRFPRWLERGLRHAE